MSEELSRYEQLEREHFGDPHKETGIYANMPTKDTSSDQYRRECEARHVLKHNRQWREAHYAAIREKRGQNAANELIAEVKRQWKLQQKEQDFAL